MRSIFGATGGVPKSRWPFAALSPTFSEMGKSSSSKKKKSAQPEPESASSTPQKAGGSPAKSKNSLSKEDAQQKVIDDLKKKLDAAQSKDPKGGKQKRSNIGAADSTTEDDEPAEDDNPAGETELPSASGSKAGSKSGSFSKLGNRANKARKLFKDKDEEEEFRAWKAMKATPVAAVPAQAVVPVQSDEAIARSLSPPVFSFLTVFLPQSLQFYESCGPHDPQVPVLGQGPRPPDDDPSGSSPRTCHEDPHRQIQAKVSPTAVPTFHPLAQCHRRGHGRRRAQGHREGVQCEVELGDRPRVPGCGTLGRREGALRCAPLQGWRRPVRKRNFRQSGKIVGGVGVSDVQGARASHDKGPPHRAAGSNVPHGVFHCFFFLET